jgi:mRNA interferase MazF
MVVAQGDIVWADLPTPAGSEAGFRRPVIVVQSDLFNRTQLKTVVCVPLTSKASRAGSPGNVLLPARSTGLRQDSIASVPHILAVDRSFLSERIGRVSANQLQAILDGIGLLLGR